MDLRRLGFIVVPSEAETVVSGVTERALIY
jgi:hypothetical protein